jgi:tight adherence protein B
MSEKALFLLMVFIVTLLLSQAFVTPLMGSSAQARRRLRARVQDLKTDADAQRHLELVRKKYQRDLSPVARFFESTPMLEPLRHVMEQAGYEHPVLRVLLLALGTGILAGLGAGYFLGWRTESLLAVPVGIALPYLLLQRRRLKRMGKLEEQLPDALSIMARALEAGLPFSEAMNIVSKETNEPLGKELEMVFNEINYGGSVRGALLGMLERVPTVPVMALVSSVLIQRETGGNLAEVLDRIGGLVRQRFRFQRSIRTLSAEGRMTAWLVSLMPFGLGGALELLSPGWMQNLTEDPIGRKLMIGAFIMLVVGILWIRRQVRIDV